MRGIKILVVEIMNTAYRNNKNIFLISGLGSNPVARVKSEFHDL